MKRLSLIKWCVIPIVLVTGILWLYLPLKHVMSADYNSDTEYRETKVKIKETELNQHLEIELKARKEAEKRKKLRKEQMLQVHVPDQLYPKSQEDLWIQISTTYVVRRIGYLDKRNAGDVSIRLISMHDKRKKTTPTIFMKLHYSSNDRSFCLPATLEIGSKLDGHDVYILYLVRSPHLTNTQLDSLSHITVATNSDCRNESSPIAINAVDAKEYKYNFSICLHKSVRPNLDPKVVLDWVKLNLALGTEFMTIYLQTGAEKIYDILLPYINKGLVEVLDWKMEPPLIAERSYHDGQTGVIAECVWRNMNRVKYLGMNDADEFFIPQRHSSLLEMIKALDTPMPKKYGSFLFTNALMVDSGRLLPAVERALKSNKCPGLDAGSLPVYFKRTQSCKTWAEKIVVIPDAVFTAWPHHLISYRSDKYTKERKVPDNIGLSQHYRPTWEGYFTKCSTSSLSDTASVGNFFANVTQCF